MREVINQKTSLRGEGGIPVLQPRNPQESNIADDPRIANLQKQVDELKARDKPTDSQTMRARNPFVSRIQQAEGPYKFKMPLIPSYGGGSDPDDHLHAFNFQMDIAGVSDDFRCRAFAGTLKGIASQWYTQLPENHIENWDQYSQEFSRQFGSHIRSLQAYVEY